MPSFVRGAVLPRISSFALRNVATKRRFLAERGARSGNRISLVARLGAPSLFVANRKGLPLKLPLARTLRAGRPFFLRSNSKTGSNQRVCSPLPPGGAELTETLGSD